MLWHLLVSHYNGMWPKYFLQQIPRLWLLLETLGKVGPSPVAARARLQEALN